MSSQESFQVIFAGVGGQGVLLASEITALVAFEEGLDVKKSEVHGMSQRGGSVVSHVRMGERVFSPLISKGQGDALVAFEASESCRYEAFLKPDAVRIDPSSISMEALPHPRTANIFIVGCLARLLPFQQRTWEKVISEMVHPNTLEMNLEAFRRGLKVSPREAQ
ncbi:MAG TPA: indolepyruvate oxidoreductase subunit beta [bacterium]|nr:indolepyruvate oxidoreductase subunit beta [bacterium]